MENKETDKVKVLFSAKQISDWAARESRNASIATKSNQRECSEQIILAEVLRVCIQKAANLRSIHHPDGLVVSMNDCINLALENATAITAEQFDAFNHAFTPIEGPQTPDWNGFRFTCRFPDENLHQDMSAALNAWRRMSGYNVTSSVFINYAIATLLQQDGFAFYDMAGEEIQDVFQLLSTPESQLGGIEMSVGKQPPQPAILAPKQKERCLPDNLYFQPVAEKDRDNPLDNPQEWSMLPIRIPMTLYRAVNMWASARQMEAVEQSNRLGAEAAKENRLLQDYSFEDVTRLMVDLYIKLEEYAEANQIPVWGNTGETVFPNSGFTGNLPPKTTSHPEKGIEYARLVPRVRNSMLNRWKTYRGSDNSKAMRGLVTLLQMSGMKVVSPANKGVEAMSLWDYFRMAKGHEEYLLCEDKSTQPGLDRVKHLMQEIEHLTAAVKHPERVWIDKADEINPRPEDKRVTPSTDEPTPS